MRGVSYSWGNIRTVRARFGGQHHIACTRVNQMPDYNRCSSSNETWYEIQAERRRQVNTSLGNSRLGDMIGAEYVDGIHERIVRGIQTHIHHRSQMKHRIRSYQDTILRPHDMPRNTTASATQ